MSLLIWELTSVTEVLQFLARSLTEITELIVFVNNHKFSLIPEDQICTVEIDFCTTSHDFMFMHHPGVG